MRKEDCFLLGHITRPHGYKGELVAVFDTDQPERYIELESVFVETHGELVPFFIVNLDQNSKGHFILRFEDIEPAEALKMIDRNLWLPLSLLPPMSGKSFYFHEVIGFDIIDTVYGSVGKCVEILESSAQPLFRIMNGETEILVPAVDQIIQTIDRDKSEITITCPEGLLELFR